MQTECTPEQLEFLSLGRREIIGRFDGGRLTSDGGGLLLREVDARIGLMERVAGCFKDRKPESIEHGVRERHNMVWRWVTKISTTTTYSDSPGIVGSESKGCPLASSSTLNRLEVSVPKDNELSGDVVG